jgi:hypothetical protein
VYAGTWEDVRRRWRSLASRGLSVESVGMVVGSVVVARPFEVVGGGLWSADVATFVSSTIGSIYNTKELVYVFWIMKNLGRRIAQTIPGLSLTD